MSVIASLLLLSALVIFTFQPVTVRVIYDDELIIKLYFMFFLLFMYPSRKKRDQKNKKKSKESLIKRLTSGKNAIRYFLKSSKMEINSLLPVFNGDAPTLDASFDMSLFDLIYSILISRSVIRATKG